MTKFLFPCLSSICFLELIQKWNDQDFNDSGDKNVAGPLHS
jgi:hypothetical protein